MVKNSSALQKNIVLDYNILHPSARGEAIVGGHALLVNVTARREVSCRRETFCQLQVCVYIRMCYFDGHAMQMG